MSHFSKVQERKPRLIYSLKLFVFTSRYCENPEIRLYRYLLHFSCPICKHICSLYILKEGRCFECDSVMFLG